MELTVVGMDGIAANPKVLGSASGLAANLRMLTRVILFLGRTSRHRVIIFLMLKGTSVTCTEDVPI